MFYAAGKPPQPVLARPRVGHIQSIDQHRQLFRPHHHAAAFRRRGPAKAPLLQALVTQLRMQVLQAQRRVLCASRTHSIRSAAGSLLAWASGTTGTGRRLLLQVDEATVCSVPPQWTDLVAA